MPQESAQGHYSSQCFMRSAVDTVLVQDQETSSPVYLGTIRTESPTVWMVTLEMLGREVAFKVDTGAAVTAIYQGSVMSFFGQTRVTETTKAP